MQVRLYRRFLILSVAFLILRPVQPLILAGKDQESLFTTAKNCRIAPNEIGANWKEEDFTYLADPVAFFESEHKMHQWEDEEAEKNSLQSIESLKKNGVKDGYLSIVNEENEGTSGGSSIVVLLLVFTSSEGAHANFKFLKKSTKNSNDITDMGDEAVLHSEPKKNTFRWLVRKKNINISRKFYGIFLL